MASPGWRMAMQVLIGRYDRVAIVGGPRAEMFSISTPMISAINTRRNWTHV